VALSSCEAEYMAMATGTQSLLWATQLLQELLSVVSPSGGALPLPIPVLRSDNRSAIALGQQDEAPHKRSKHIDIRHHFVREQIEAGKMRVEWVASQEQVADILTKALPTPAFKRLRDRLVTPLPQEAQRASVKSA
jgi:hypothetical protein